PLRDRGTDLDHYVHRFVARWSQEEAKTITGVEPGVLDFFHRHPWPGNVRELDLVIGRMVARAQHGRLTVDLLPPEISGWRVTIAATHARENSDRDQNGFVPRREHSKAEVEQALERSGGVARRAARRLGIARSTLYRLMAKYGIQPR